MKETKGVEKWGWCCGFKLAPRTSSWVWPFWKPGMDRILSASTVTDVSAKVNQVTNQRNPFVGVSSPPL